MTAVMNPRKNVEYRPTNLRGIGIATPSSKRRVDGVEVDATIQNERAVNFDFHTVHDVVQVHEAVAISIARIKSVPQYGVVVLINRFST